MRTLLKQKKYNPILFSEKVFLRIFLLMFLMFWCQEIKAQIATLELGVTDLSSNSTGAALFTSKDINLSTFPNLTLTSSQQGQQGGTGFVSSKKWNTASINTSAYWQFTITPSTNYQVTITSVKIRTKIINNIFNNC